MEGGKVGGMCTCEGEDVFLAVGRHACKGGTAGFIGAHRYMGGGDGSQELRVTWYE
jgi:hypothetical protein